MATIDTSLFPSANVRFQMAEAPSSLDMGAIQQQKLANQVTAQNLATAKRNAQKQQLTDAMRDVMTHETPEDAIASIDRHVADGTLTPEQAADAKSKVPVRGADGSLPQGSMAAWRQRNFDDYLATNEQLYAQMKENQRQQRISEIMGMGATPAPAAAPTNALAPAPVDQEQALFNQLNPQPVAPTAAPTNALVSSPAQGVDVNALRNRINALYMMGEDKLAASLEKQLPEPAETKQFQPTAFESEFALYKQDPAAYRRFKEAQKVETGGGAKATEAVSDTGITKAERNKREAAYPKVAASYRGAVAEIDTLANDLAALRNHPGLSKITGFVAGQTINITPEARAAQALLDKILARGQFRELQNMRVNSPTGGALGNVSDTEGQNLRRAFGAFDQKQDTPDFQNAIDAALNQLQFSKQNIASQFEDTYAYRSGSTPSAPAAGGSEDIKSMATSAFGSYEPNKYEYRVNPSTGKVQRKAK